MTTSYNKDFILFIILNQPSFTLLSEDLWYMAKIVSEYILQGKGIYVYIHVGINFLPFKLMIYVWTLEACTDAYLKW